MPEDECLFPGVQGIEFVAYAGELAGMPARDAMQRAHEVLDYVGLGEARYRRAAAEAAQAAEANAKFRAFFEQGTNFAGVLS